VGCQTIAGNVSRKRNERRFVQISTSPTRSSAPASLDTPVFPRNGMLPFMLVTILFFLWGMSNNLTDILVQQFKKSFELSPLQAQLVQTAVFFGYFCMALPAALFMRRWGYKAGILAGLCMFGSGMLLFWPAAIVGHYGLFLGALFIVGCGSAVLETASNPFIAQFGPAATSERRLNFSQAFNPPGTISGVLLGTFVIISGVELSPAKVAQMKAAGTYAAYLHGEVMRVVPTYVGFGFLVLFWALLIGLTKFPAMQSEGPGDADQGSFRELLHYPQLWFAVIAQFFYCGAQVTTWSGLFFYVKQYSIVKERTAFLYLIATLVALAAGRIVSTPLMRYFSPAKMTGTYAVINIALVAFAILHPGTLGAYALVLTSFFMSIMFPTIFALGIKGLGPNTKMGGSIIVMAVVGAGILPPLLGLVAKHTGSYALGYTVAAAAYVVVALYGFSARRDLSLESVDRVPDAF
jgi:FHS family L-fucose permease-like MFS transporter